MRLVLPHVGLRQRWVLVLKVTKQGSTELGSTEPGSTVKVVEVRVSGISSTVKEREARAATELGFVKKKLEEVVPPLECSDCSCC